jgi:nucleotide-binding universal stress UspA family protein
MYKAILVHVDIDDPGSLDRVAAAHRIAGECGAALIGAAAALPPATIEVISSGAATLAAGIVTGDPHELEERFKAAEIQFRQAASGDAVRLEWRTAVDFPANALASMAARADIVVTGPARPSAPSNSYLDYGDLVMKAGRPVLVMPAGAAQLEREVAVVAWRNTREARRAVADALPLLEDAGTVHLIHIREGREDLSDRASLPDAEAYLRGHGINPNVHLLDAGDLPAGRRLVEFATRSQARLIVAGAYGHTRLREWVFGGVTRDLLRGCPFACLFSH